MTPNDNFAEALAAWQPIGSGRQTWSHLLPAEGWVVGLEADRSDSVGCVAWQLSLARTGSAPLGQTTRKWADKIAARVTGLLEPLKVVEVDDPAAEAILRSTTPSKRGPNAAYYEIALSGTEKASVRRFHSDPKAGTPRTQVSFSLTHEVLAKLVDDMIRD
ncbi:MAG TPA: hypothetical protein VGJ05_01595 [Fimbriiglobus sp.]|jgi:hypothetical protein